MTRRPSVGWPATILFAALALVTAYTSAHAQGAAQQPVPDVSGLQSTIQTLQGQIATLQAQTSQPYDVTLDANGNGVVNFSPAFTAAPRIAYFPQNPSTSGSQISCNWQTRTAAQLAFHCDKSGVLSLLQVPFNPFGNPAAGAMVTVVARGTIAQ